MQEHNHGRADVERSEWDKSDLALFYHNTPYIEYDEAEESEIYDRSQSQTRVNQRKLRFRQRLLLVLSLVLHLY